MGFWIVLGELSVLSSHQGYCQCISTVTVRFTLYRRVFGDTGSSMHNVTVAVVFILHALLQPDFTSDQKGLVEHSVVQLH